jgi:shikimate 5-dehydrogenase
MLVLQAAEAHRIWYGAAFEKTGIEELVEDAVREMERHFRG